MKQFSPKFTITNSITNALTAIERARGFLEAAVLSDDWISRMSKRAILLEAHYTTHIEGTQLTLEQAQQIWGGNEPIDINPDDKRELLNYRNAFNLVADYLSNDLPITETLIREIHKRLVEGVRGGQGKPGQYRLTQNYVVNSKTKQVIYTPPAAAEVPPLMCQLTDWLETEKDVHPVMVAGIAQFQLVHIHPFVDGNGRTSRLLSTLYLYRNGYDFKKLFTISEYYDRNRLEFYKAIQSVRENDMDMTGWLEYFAKGLSTQLEETKLLGKTAIKADIISKENKLNSRQEMAVEHLLSQGKLTIADFEKLCPEATRRTLQRDIKSLIDKGLIQEISSGATDPTRHYILQEL